MRNAPQIESVSGGSAMSMPIVLIVLIITLGATIFLRQQRYMRRNTARVLVGVLILMIAAVCVIMYRSGS